MPGTVLGSGGKREGTETWSYSPVGQGHVPGVRVRTSRHNSGVRERIMRLGGSGVREGRSLC